MTCSFERAALAVVDGDAGVLREALAAEPELAQARSSDAFGAALLHFVAANGVPDEMQRTPVNAVEITRILLAAGADPDVLCRADGGGGDDDETQTPLCLLVSSWHPFDRGVQADLVRTLVEAGAAADGRIGDGAPLATALTFGYTGAAEALVEVGARVRRLAHHAGLGRLDDVRALMADEEVGAIQEAFHLAVTHGRLAVAELLLDHGADVNGRTAGQHCELPLLQAAFVRESEAALWLLERGADPDLVDGKRGESARSHVRQSGPAAVADRITRAD